MTETMMGLGDFRFSMNTAAYQRLVRSTAWRWAAQERTGRRPARQYVGPGDDTLELEGVIYPHYRGGLGQIDELRKMAGQGESFLVVDGRGKVWKRWCIESVSETQTVFFADGTPRKIEFVLQLARYGEDG